MAHHRRANTSAQDSVVHIERSRSSVRLRRQALLATHSSNQLKEHVTSPQSPFGLTLSGQFFLNPSNITSPSLLAGITNIPPAPSSSIAIHLSCTMLHVTQVLQGLVSAAGLPWQPIKRARDGWEAAGLASGFLRKLVEGSLA